MGLSPTSGLGGAGLGGAGIGGAGISKGAAAPAYVGPLDLVSGASVAHSIRALSSSELGQNIFRLRRLSDDAELDFAADATTGEPPSADIETWIGASRGFVRTAYNQSENNNLVQTTGDNQPEFFLNQYDGLPVYGFYVDPHPSGNPYLVTENAVNLPGEFTIFMVIKLSGLSGALCGMNFTDFSGDGDAFIFKQDAADGPILACAATSDGFIADYVDVASVAGADVSSAHCVVDVSAGTDSVVFYLNNTLIANNTSNNAGTLGTINQILCVGANDAATPQQFPEGTYAEFLLYPRVLTAPEKLQIRQNIATFYGITLS